jgi:hypothetical protein
MRRYEKNTSGIGCIGRRWEVIRYGPCGNRMGNQRQGGECVLIVTVWGFRRRRCRKNPSWGLLNKHTRSHFRPTGRGMCRQAQGKNSPTGAIPTPATIDKWLRPIEV